MGKSGQVICSVASKKGQGKIWEPPASRLQSLKSSFKIVLFLITRIGMSLCEYVHMTAGISGARGLLPTLPS